MTFLPQCPSPYRGNKPGTDHRKVLSWNTNPFGFETLFQDSQRWNPTERKVLLGSPVNAISTRRCHSNEWVGEYSTCFRGPKACVRIPQNDFTSVPQEKRDVIFHFMQPLNYFRHAFSVPDSVVSFAMF